MYVSLTDISAKSFQDLYDWSVSDKRNEFWTDAWETAGMIHEGGYTHVSSACPSLIYIT